MQIPWALETTPKLPGTPGSFRDTRCLRSLGQLEQKRISQLWRQEGARPRRRQIWCLVTAFPGHSLLSSPCVLTGPKGGGARGAGLRKSLVPPWALALLTSSPPDTMPPGARIVTCTVPRTTESPCSHTRHAALSPFTGVFDSTNTEAVFFLRKQKNTHKWTTFCQKNSTKRYTKNHTGHKTNSTGKTLGSEGTWPVVTS